MARAETIKIGLLRLPSSAPIFIAKEKGYFAGEGLDPELVYFASAESIAVAVVAGGADFVGRAVVISARPPSTQAVWNQKCLGL